MTRSNYHKTHHLMKDLANTIETVLPGMGFALLVFHFETPGVANYVSNAQREDMILALKEAAERFENGETIPLAKGEA